MDFEDIVLSEIIGQRKTNSEYLTYMQNLENNNPNSGKELICGYHKWSVGEGTTG